MRLLWCVTGGGYLLRQCVGAMEDMSGHHEISLLFSDAGFEVTKAYGLFDKMSQISCEIIKKQGPSCPVSGSNRFEAVIVAPATANTVAKIVNGIADTSVTNVVAQFLKRNIEVVFLPTDSREKVESEIPSGKMMSVYPREVDIKNVGILKKMGGVTVVEEPGEIEI